MEVGTKVAAMEIRTILDREGAVGAAEAIEAAGATEADTKAAEEVAEDGATEADTEAAEEAIKPADVASRGGADVASRGEGADVVVVTDKCTTSE